MDLRCENKKHAEFDDGIISIKCSSRFCGAGSGVVVIHRWVALTGEELETQRFRDPVPAAQKKGTSQ